MSEKSVAQKLLIKENYKVLIVNAPQGYDSILGSLPPNVTVSTEPSGLFDLIQVFVTSAKQLEEQLSRLKGTLQPGGLLWVTYPKGTSKTKVDINRDSIARYAQSIRLQAVAMVSVDDTWSALRLKTL